MRFAQRIHNAVDSIDKELAHLRARNRTRSAKSQMKGSTKVLDAIQDDIETLTILVADINDRITEHVPEEERYRLDITFIMAKIDTAEPVEEANAA
jgi:hypothetical protein